MYKHALMLTAATVALSLGTTAYADTTISTTVNKAQTTSTAGNILVGDTTSSPVKNGTVSVSIANPAIEINSANYVQITTASSAVSNNGISGAIGVQMDAATTPNGPGVGTDALYSIGQINLTGTGTSKYGILVTPVSGSTNPQFNGNIDLGAGSTTTVTGDSSVGVEVATGSQLNGDIKILGTLIGNPSSTVASTGGNVTGIRLNGILNGNVLINSGGSVQAYGQGAQGLVVANTVTGNITNNGALDALGIQNALINSVNPEASSALIVAGSVQGGIYNAGPLSSGSSTVRAAITTYGNAPAVLISSSGAGAVSPTPMTIGTYTTITSSAVPQVNGSYSFVNRGAISSHPYNADLNGTIGVNLQGDAIGTVTFSGGLYNPGTISASATTDAKATSVVTASGIIVGNYVNLPSIVVDNAESGGGSVTSSVSGAYAASTAAIAINQYGNMPLLVNNGGSITATASSTSTTITNPGNTSSTTLPGLSAYAVEDLSGTLTTIDNYGGLISASATQLANNSQVAVALGLSAAKGNVTINNTGNILGEVLLGSHNDTINVSGTSSTPASIIGNISLGGGLDTLNIGDFGTVKGSVTEFGGGSATVTVGSGAGTGTLILTNTTQGLTVNTLHVKSGGTLGMSISQAFNSTAAGYVGPVIQAVTVTSNNVTTPGAITLDPNSKFTLNYQSFISTPNPGQPAQFVLLDAPAGQLSLGNFASIQTTIEGNSTNKIAGQIPYLFTGNVCTFNVSAVSDCAGPSPTLDSQLVLNLQPKSAAQLGLTGNTAKIFPYANAALATDSTLGGNFVSDITNAAQAQAAYNAFLPDLSGSSRAVLVSITDQASGPVAQRQRDLRMYADKQGGTTLWGQEFFQRMDTGRNIEGYKGSGFGFAIGADKGTPESGRYGAAITFFSGDQTNKAPDFAKTTNQWYLLTGYTDWRNKGIFLDTQGSFGYGALKGRRYMQLTNPTTGSIIYTRAAANKHAALALAGGFSTGAILTYGGTVITPQFSLDALTMREEGYTETGGGSGTTGADGFDLIVAPYYASSARAYLGSSIRQDIDLGGFYLQPELHAGYRYDFLASPVKLHAAFASLPTSKFALTGPNPTRGNIVAGGTLSVATGTWSLGVNYDYLRSTSGGVDQMGTLTLLGRF